MNNSCISITNSLKKINDTVTLTGSKSESNRALIIEALSDGLVQVENLSEAADTVTLQNALQKVSKNENSDVIDIGPAGTAMRFLTAYLNLVKGKFTLTGSARMQERPIGILVDALKEIGADIHYAKKSGFPPLVIDGGMFQSKNTVSIKGDISSQYISALLLIAAKLKKGLTLQIQGELTSKPYVLMTLNMLEESGIKHHWQEKAIEIPNQTFQKTTLYIEPDWSAASYWYSIVALADNAKIILPGLKAKSLQGDIAIVHIMKHFGVSTTFTDQGIVLEKIAVEDSKKLFDFKECPDLAQTIVVLAAALGKNVSFTGLETLKIKETDRIAALQCEIKKFGASLIADGDVYHLQTADIFEPEELTFATYEDHRMAMALAPLALRFKKINIEEPQVVEKSYPDFWKHLQQVGFSITEN